MTQQNKTVIVVGGGLAGLSAAIEAHDQGNTRVILIEKEDKVGGNSMKASSGINAIENTTGDSREAFIQDTLKSGDGLSNEELVTKLVDESQSSLDWLIHQSEFDAGKPTLDLSLVSRCGGHSFGRTHRCPPENGRPVPVGWKLIDTLKKRLTSLPHTQVMTQTRVLGLLSDDSQRVCGVRLESDEEITADAVILTSGGFGGQTGTYLTDGKATLLSEFAPQLVHTATTNGPWANGDGIRLGLSVKAGIRDMDKVQLHPTGFIDPSNPTLPTKFLAPEALRAYGGIMLNGDGKRFVDELNLREHVTKKVFGQTDTVHNRPNSWMFKVVPKKYPAAYLVLTEEAVESFGKSTLGFYASKGFFTRVEGIDNLAKDVLNVEKEEIESIFKEYDAHIDNATPDHFGKEIFPSRLLVPTTYWVALVTPVVHYTMGGLNINANASILAQDGETTIQGLYGAGEVTGGVHGRNRLAGNSLLECVVFGRTAGRNAAIYAQSLN
ncbi:hypothetical protein G6F46_007722 [Rhizopus delemar]|uniref:Fumarate reductase n=2 Tax=Rhizopus TaxID=4842 RepID=A0A9P6Z083_9FUNG|nr:hypothetical protein G6F55_006572 [Rhizopus delemar]KAG1541276.1 hypothetical protein G6F51_007992 [Rhizopus arrhizus]KAG1495350.1 hypothetical protein G6F54_007234 [Rhizopus delemar]KAG1509443.1 hypothetical protein G6F53_007442 [Rhizopus delemar]KAG1525017.1 hypothetical protein G6F52_003693 [Rhizopus delemar]